MEIGQIQIKDLPHKSTLNPADRLPVQNVSGGIGSTGSIPLEWLLSRSNHTGTITINDVQNLQAILDNLLLEINAADPLPDITDNENKFLTNDGSTVYWDFIPNEIPDFYAQTGKFLSNNGDKLQWISAPDPIPLQAGNEGKVLTTDGTNVFWTDIASPLPDHAGNFGKYLYTDGQSITWASVIDITGPTSLTVYQSGTYTITNFDSFTTYTVTCTSGTVSRTGATITYTAPASPGIAGFNVNGVNFGIAIGAVTINAPSITSPTNLSDKNALKPVLIGTALSLSSGTGTHVSSQWQIASDNAFSAMVIDSYEDFVNKTSYQSALFLNNDTTYYARVRYREVNLGWSPWSATISFSTLDLKNDYASYTTTSTAFVEYLSDGYIYACTDDNKLSRIDRNTLAPILTKQYSFTSGSTTSPYEIKIGSIIKIGLYYYIGLYSISSYGNMDSSKIFGIAKLNSNLDIISVKNYLVPANDPNSVIPDSTNNTLVGTALFCRGQIIAYNDTYVGILLSYATNAYNYYTGEYAFLGRYYSGKLLTSTIILVDAANLDILKASPTSNLVKLPLIYATGVGIENSGAGYSRLIGYREYMFNRESIYMKDKTNNSKFIFYDEYRTRADELNEELHSSIAEYTIGTNINTLKIKFENLYKFNPYFVAVLLSRSLTFHNNIYYSFASFMERDHIYSGAKYVSAICLACITYDVNFNKLSHTVWRIPIEPTPTHSPSNTSDWFVTKVVSEKMQNGFLVGLSVKTKNNSTSKTIFGIVPFNLSNINSVVKLTGLSNGDNLYKSFYDGYGNIIISIKGSNDIFKLSDSITEIPKGTLPNLPTLSFQTYTDSTITNVTSIYSYSYYGDQQQYPTGANWRTQSFTEPNSACLIDSVSPNLTSATATTLVGTYSEF